NPDMSVSCPDDLPASCPSPTPSWDGGVAATVTAKCVPCHRPGGAAYDRPLTDYAHVYPLRGLILDQVYSCYMPPPEGTPLDAQERQSLLGWLVCGAPNN